MFFKNHVTKQGVFFHFYVTKQRVFLEKRVTKQGVFSDFFVIDKLRLAPEINQTCELNQ